MDNEQAHPNLINRRMAHVSVSRARNDTQIYTNDKANLAEQLSRDISHRSAIELGGSCEPVHKIGLASLQSQVQEKAAAHWIGR